MKIAINDNGHEMGVYEGNDENDCLIKYFEDIGYEVNKIDGSNLYTKSDEVISLETISWDKVN